MTIIFQNGINSKPQFLSTLFSNFWYFSISTYVSNGKWPKFGLSPLWKTFCILDHCVKITSFGYLFQIPKTGAISSNFMLDGPLPKVKRDSFKQSKIVTYTQHEVINAQVSTNNKDILHCFCYFRIPTKLKADLKDNV